MTRIKGDPLNFGACVSSASSLSFYLHGLLRLIVVSHVRALSGLKMPRNIMFLDCVLESLDGRYSEDLIRWNDYDQRIFEISFRHGNSKKGGISQFEAAQVWLAWDKKKNRLPDFDQMEMKAINQYLTEVRQRYRQALKSQVVAGILKRLPCEKFKERFQILPREERKPGKRSRNQKRRRQSSISSSEPDSPSFSEATSPSSISTDDEQKPHYASNAPTYNHLVLYVTYIAVPQPVQHCEIPEIWKEEELSACELEDPACFMFPQVTETIEQDFQKLPIPEDKGSLLNINSPLICDDTQLLQDIIFEEDLPDKFGAVPLLDLTSFNLEESLDDIHTLLCEEGQMLQD